jgi:3-deoxy-D-manno-octulosonic-acid transferase
VGGGFKQGLHNILEPATFGMPIFFGNKAYQKFREAQELIQKQGAFAIKDAQELFEIFIKLYENNELRFEKKRITQNYVQEHTGGTEKILAKIAELL